MIAGGRWPTDLPNHKWWVFFTGTLVHQRRWYKLWPSYRMPFQHCYAACEVAPEIILFIDPQVNGIVRSFVVGRPKAHIDTVLRLGGKVLFVEFPADRPDLDHTRGRNRRAPFLTCASAIAYELGLDTRALTPKGLHRVLLDRYGAEEIEPDERRRRTRRAEPAGAPEAP